MKDPKQQSAGQSRPQQQGGGSIEEQVSQGASAEERQADLGKTEVEDFFRLDKNSPGKQMQQESESSQRESPQQRQPRGEEEDAEGKSGLED